MGDTIYSDTEVPGYTLADVALTVKQKWEAYKTNLAMKPWAKARGAAAYYAHWDDHEFVNDFSRFEDTFPLSVGDVNVDGEQLYKRGVQAFTDYNPITYSKQGGIYRSVRWGKNLEVFFLDERSFRSSSSDYQGLCDNPAGSGNPDLAPTAPQSTRNVFSAIAPQLANPVPAGCTASINDPNRTMLGSKQLKAFKKAVAKSSATFKVIFNEVPIQQYYALPYDRWEGYEAERQALLRLPARQGRERRLPDHRRARQPRQRRPLQHPRRRRGAGLGDPRRDHRPGRDRLVRRGDQRHPRHAERRRPDP